MDPRIPSSSQDHSSAHNSTDIPSHGNLPKWFEEISQEVVESHDLASKPKCHYSYREMEMKFFNTVTKLNNTNIVKKKEEQQKYKKIKNEVNRDSNQIIAESSWDGIVTKKSDYLIPKFDGKFDCKILHPNPYDFDLEKYWKSLDDLKN